MSTEKVVRWDVCSTEVTPCKVEFDLCPTPNGRYIEYADVAGLLDALRNVLSADGVFDKLAAEKGAKAALARFQR